MGYDDLIIQRLSIDEFTPPVGQGSIAIEAVTTLEDAKKAFLKTALNDEPTACRLTAERAYLRKLEGGCSIPAFANAQLVDKALVISGGIVRLDGSEIIRHQMEVPQEQAEAAGSALADYILRQGGRAILEDIRRQQA